MVLKHLILLGTIVSFAVGQRPFFAGSRPIGYPEVTTTPVADDLGNRFGEGDSNVTTTTQRLPIEANGDKDLIDRLSKLPIDKQPFWFINWQALEANRNKPQTYPIRPSSFAQPILPQNPDTSGFIAQSEPGIGNRNIADDLTNTARPVEINIGNHDAGFNTEDNGHSAEKPTVITEPSLLVQPLYSTAPDKIVDDDRRKENDEMKEVGNQNINDKSTTYPVQPSQVLQTPLNTQQSIYPEYPLVAPVGNLYNKYQNNQRINPNFDYYKDIVNAHKNQMSFLSSPLTDQNNVQAIGYNPAFNAEHYVDDSFVDTNYPERYGSNYNVAYNPGVPYPYPFWASQQYPQYFLS